MTNTTAGIPETLDLKALRRRADSWMLGALALGAAVAVALGLARDLATLAFTLAGALLLAGAALHTLARGTLLSRCVFPVLLMAMVALQIQLGAGRTECHFGVFVTLAFLLLYRDWKPLVIGAGAIALHHIAFDRLQALGFPVYCTTEPDFLRVLAHAGYVVVQTGFEIVIGERMRRDAVQGHELNRIVTRLQQGDRLALDTSSTRATSAAALMLQSAIARMSGAIGQVDQASSTIGSAVNEIAAGQLDLSTRTETAASNLQQTAATLHQLTDTLRESADTAREAHRLAAAASAAATRGGTVVGEVVGDMDQISRSSHQIADIIGVIDGIAFQTNILALNAAVEAARAGEHGRGFAVVATEVRQLAQRSAQAAREIKSLIEASTGAVAAGVQRVGDAGRTMGEIVHVVEQVSGLIGTLSVSVAGQHDGIGQLNDVVARLDAMTQQNSALVEQSSAASQSLRDQVQRLADVVRVFLIAPVPQQA
ncbi:MAG: methyl-accepting chemotaxis protein [Rhizobacter sp.]